MTQAVTEIENTAQIEFERKYITASEVMKELSIARPALMYARRSGHLPTPIVANDGRLYLWEREVLKPYLDAWKQALASRRGV